MLNKVMNSIKYPRFGLYLATGLYQLTIGLLTHLVVNILMGVSLIVLYPYINPQLLCIIQIIGWLLLFFACYTILYPFIREYLKQRTLLSTLSHLIIKISIILTFLLIPLGIFLGIGLLSEIKAYKVGINNEFNIVNKRSRLVNVYTFIAGSFHVIFGLLITLIIVPFIKKEIDFLFPYITYNLMDILSLYGWISCIAGSILIFCSIWIGHLQDIKKLDKKLGFLKLIRILIIFASSALLLIYPFGTFFGLTLILEFNPFKKN